MKLWKGTFAEKILTYSVRISALSSIFGIKKSFLIFTDSGLKKMANMYICHYKA
jgi:hypothetical protein